MSFSIHVHDVLEQHDFYYSFICTRFHTATGSTVDDVGIMLLSVNLLIIGRLYSFYFVKKKYISRIFNCVAMKIWISTGNIVNASTL